MVSGIYKTCDNIESHKNILRKLFIELYVHYTICIPIPQHIYNLLFQFATVFLTLIKSICILEIKFQCHFSLIFYKM